MGITGGLVKSVFSRTRSLGSHDNNARSNVTEKRRWNSVRSYLCGDELINSGLADEDYGSVKSSEATTMLTHFDSVLAEHDSVLSVENSTAIITTQLSSVLETEDDDSSSEATVTQPIQEQEIAGSASKAAIIIQSAFRGFMARRDREGTEVFASPNRESLAQTGNSEERMTIHHQTNQKLRTQVIKEDWDDSTVSSNISRMRIQNRLEATTRRERALAYAFSQQLRVCSKKKEPKSNGGEPNMGWSWLERWMATRLPESDNCVGRSVGFKTSSITGEEKESCGSNDVSVSFDVPTMNRMIGRGVSRRKTVQSYRSPRDYTKVKKEGSFKGEFRRQKV